MTYDRRILIDALAHRPLLRRMVRPLVAVAAFVVAGVGGFSALAGASLVDAAFWLLDPTSIELHYQTHEGPATLVKAYAIVILTGLIGTGLWAGETFVSAAFGGQIREELDQMKLQREIAELESHIIVCGYGTFGKTVAARLREMGRDVVVVESKEAQYQRALDADLLAVEGDARREDRLEDAGVERATTVVGAIDDSKVNIQIAIAASRLSPDAKLVVRAGDQMDEALARRAGADEVVVPEIVSGEQVCSDL
ncbi:potassium channel family protein [Haloferax prahovense]|uniref:potassium channel family protein n=1 Tax=Haloferax TaxID=2251 RepID=UPI0009EAA465|nr:NAD(P)-binding protein [Haloferax sp. Q22]